MNARPRTTNVLGPVALGSAVLIVLAAWDARVSPAQDRAPAKTVANPAGPRWLGAGSCSAFACHGGNGPLGDDRSAYGTWLALDPHSRAYEVLGGSVSKTIADRLAAPTGRPPTPPESDARCLSCHVRAREGSTRNLDQALRRAGVGCESCHGPAEQWIEPHSLPAWKQSRDEAKRALGMIPLEDLSARAQACVGCHVGESGREVNHDLIAAGHPRLNFEFRAFHDHLPAHWDRAKDKRDHPDFEARAWEIGQTVSASASLELLSARARDAASNAERIPPSARPWPEFAEYDCASCHHDLSKPAWLSERVSDDVPPGQLSWGAWYFSLVPVLGGLRNGTDPDTLKSLLRKLGQQLAGPDFNPSQVAQLAGQLLAELTPSPETNRQGVRFDAKTTGDLLTRLIKDSRDLDRLSRDRATQLTLAIVALDRTLADLGASRGPESRAALDALLHLLTSDAPDASFPRLYREALGRYERAITGPH